MVVNDHNNGIEADADSMPAEFQDTVRELLEHLYDLPFLQQHPLTRHPAILLRQSGEAPTQLLRNALLSAVESLQPPEGHALGSQLARAYGVTSLHYIDGMTVHEASHQLGISLRQAYRDLQRGVESVASLMWERLQAANAVAQTAEAAVSDDVERLLPRPVTTDLTALCDKAIRAIGPLAAQKSVALVFEQPSTPVMVATDRPVAQQILVHVLSGLIQHGQPQQLTMRVDPAPLGAALVTIACTNVRSVLGGDARNDVTQQLATKLGWTIEFVDDGTSGQIVRLLLPSGSRMLLVIDDNIALADLLDRYLGGTDYRVIAAANPADGLRLSQELKPEAVLLDVMMPDIDGWEVLQRMRNSPVTADIPVIICTVFNDSELAYSLGASYFLPKPVVRADFLGILRSLQSKTRNVR